MAGDRLPRRCGWKALAVLSLWTRWPLIQIWVRTVAFRDLSAEFSTRFSTGLTSDNRSDQVAVRPLLWVGNDIDKAGSWRLGDADRRQGSGVLAAGEHDHTEIEQLVARADKIATGPRVSDRAE